MSASPSRARIAVTGLGTVNPLGGDVASTWQAALAGTSTARTLDNDWKDVYGLSVDFACQLAPGALDELPRPQAKKLDRSEEHTSELQSRGHLVCRLLLEKKKTTTQDDLDT